MLSGGENNLGQFLPKSASGGKTEGSASAKQNLRELMHQVSYATYLTSEVPSCTNFSRTPSLTYSIFNTLVVMK